jgi:excisionase family DNA binding protein
MEIQKPVTVEGAMMLTGFSRYYIYKLIHLKKIPCYKPNGGRVFFKQEDLEAFIFRNQQAANYEGVSCV